jgi:hypothetical protein
MLGRDLAQFRQHRFDSQPNPEIPDGRRTARQQMREQTSQSDQRHAHHLDASSQPAQSAWKFGIQGERLHRFLLTCAALDCLDGLLELNQSARQM